MALPPLPLIPMLPAPVICPRPPKLVTAAPVPLPLPLMPPIQVDGLGRLVPLALPLVLPMLTPLVPRGRPRGAIE